jgi:methylmalonyl-CoA mutase
VKPTSIRSRIGFSRSLRELSAALAVRRACISGDAAQNQTYDPASETAMTEPASPPDETFELGDTFPSATEADWRLLAEKALKGGDFERRLVSHSRDGAALRPVYPEAEQAHAVVRTEANAPWAVHQRVDHPEPLAAAEQAMVDLEGGASGLSICFPASQAAHGFGVACDTVNDLDRSLKGVALDMIATRLEPAPAGRVNAAMFAALVARRGLSPEALDVSFGLDPLGTLVSLGGFSADWSEVTRRLADTVSALRDSGFKGPFIACDTRPYHNAGATEAQELATALALGVGYWRGLADQGIALADAERALEWTFAVDADQFLGLGKLRAFRRLWRRVQEASGVPLRPVRIHAETSWRMQSRLDAPVNMLRNTIAAFTAGIGGADSISVLPHTLAHGLPAPLARRIARNLQLILLEESNLWRVADPAAGAGAYEDLTDQLCAKAWAAFQEIEAGGGLVAALESGSLQQRIASARAERLADVASGKTPLTGTSAFPLLEDAAPEVLDVAPDDRRGIPKLRAGKPDTPFAEVVAALKDGGTRGDVMPGPQNIVTVADLPVTRVSEPFEDIRARADGLAAANGTRPTVFIAALGPLAEHTARATWIGNLLASGGIAVDRPVDGFTQSGDVGAAFARSGLSVAIICGSDDTYAQLAEATAQALKSAGASRVYLAGRPGTNEADLAAAGIDGFIFSGVNVVGTLETLLADLN